MFFRLTRTIELQRLFICQRVHGNINFFSIFLCRCGSGWSEVRVEADGGGGASVICKNRTLKFADKLLIESALKLCMLS